MCCGDVTIKVIWFDEIKEYISDVQQNIIELHKLESGFKKSPISTIRVIIKMFQSTEHFMNLPGREHASISS